MDFFTITEENAKKLLNDEILAEDYTNDCYEGEYEGMRIGSFGAYGDYYIDAMQQTDTGIIDFLYCGESYGDYGEGVVFNRGDVEHVIHLFEEADLEKFAQEVDGVTTEEQIQGVVKSLNEGIEIFKFAKDNNLLVINYIPM